MAVHWRLATSGNLGLRLRPPPVLELGRRQVACRTMETLVVPPVDPFAGFQLDKLGPTARCVVNPY